MAPPTPNHLRLFNERLETVDRPDEEVSGSVTDLCQAFERATGWSLRYVPGGPPSTDHDLLWSAPVDPGVGGSPGHLRIDLGGAELGESGPRVDLDLAGELAASVAQLLSELHTGREELRKREAELATGVPVIERDGDARPHLAERLEAVLRGGAEAVGCHAAAVYLLDSATTELKLRAAWGLPRERLTLAPRPLRTANADLEALAGHAVVMKNRAVRAEWSAPEAAAAAVCVPISSPTIPLGTLWLFSARERDFDDREVNLIEMVAGRLAGDLEREVLMREGLQAATLKRQLNEAERLQEIQLPRATPLSDCWDVDAWTIRGDRLGGDFYDWFPHGDGGLSVAVGSASGHGVVAAMLAGVLRTAVRAHADAAREPNQLLDAANGALWQAAAGLQSASLFYALLDATGRIRLATAGDVTALLARPAAWQLLSRPALPLSRDPGTHYQPCLHQLKPEEALVVLTAGELGTGEGHPLDPATVARLVGDHMASSAQALAAELRARLTPAQAAAMQHDRTLLVVKRRRPS
ncbi:MAG: SpoIIE family protein phosphatase [Planctomycetia bacterium]|nr:SpoIIE family protein phosphatase [Planctomycetia bacterium]